MWYKVLRNSFRNVNQNTRYLDYMLLTPLCDNPGISLVKKRMCLHPDLVITSLALFRIYIVALGMTRVLRAGQRRRPKE